MNDCVIGSEDCEACKERVASRAILRMKKQKYREKEADELKNAVRIGYKSLYSSNGFQNQASAY